MSLQLATVSKILTFSCVDGPGNRLVIFFQGCNFNCRTCHNPQTIGVCNHCGDCVLACPEHALATDNNGHVVWNSDKCTQCDKCLDVCPESSNPKTKQYSVADLISIIEENHLFLTGITVSGGEATLHLPFIIELFESIKEHSDLKHLTCFIDSNGNLTEKAWTKLTTLSDGVMVDLKAWQRQTHQWLTGKDNHRIIRSIKYLASINKLHEVRILFIPKHTDFIEHIEELSKLLLSLPVDVRIRVNAFSTHGVTGDEKYWEPCSQQQLTEFIELLKSKGIKSIESAALLMPDQ